MLTSATTNNEDFMFDENIRVRPILLDSLTRIGQEISIKKWQGIWLVILETATPTVLIQFYFANQKYQTGQDFLITIGNFFSWDKMTTIGVLLGIIIALLNVIAFNFKKYKASHAAQKNIDQNLRQEIVKLEQSIRGIYKSGFPIHLGIMNYMEKNSRLCYKSEPDRNRHCSNDKHIMSPLTYCYNIVSQIYQPPPFNPDAKYIEALFSQGTKNVIAITGADPSMWLDPILLFYLINTGLLSISYDFNRLFEAANTKKESFTHRIKFTRDREDNAFIQFENEKRKLLKQLIEESDFVSKGKFVARFFILKPEDLKNYSDGFLPSLVAIHDMFRIRSYFIKAEGLLREIENKKLKSKYNDLVNSIYQKLNFKNGEPMKCIDGLYQPEFLIFPEQHHDRASQIYSYKEGTYLSAIDDPNCSVSLELIKLIADICNEKEFHDYSFWYKPPGGDETNRSHCLFDIESESL